MKNRLFLFLLIVQYLILVSFCLNSCRGQKYSINGHWHPVYDSVKVPNHYNTLDIIDDSISIFNRYSIPKADYNKGRIIEKNDTLLLKNKFFTFYRIYLKKDTLIMYKKEFNNNYKWIKYNDTFKHQIKDAFSTLYLDINLDTLNGLKPLSSLNYPVFINVGRAKTGYKYSRKDTFLIQCGDRLCNAASIKDYLKVSKMQTPSDIKKFPVIISFDKEVPEKMKMKIINITQNIEFVEVYLTFIDTKHSYIGVKKF